MEKIFEKWGAKQFFIRWMREAVASGAALLAFAVAGTTLNPSSFGSWGDLWAWITKLVLVFASGFIAGLASALSKLIRVKKEDNAVNSDVSDIGAAGEA
jgi:pheromone shutdown protein TraB